LTAAGGPRAGDLRTLDADAVALPQRHALEAGIAMDVRAE
jgi:hypothetical protein